MRRTYKVILGIVILVMLVALVFIWKNNHQSVVAPEVTPFITPQQDAREYTGDACVAAGGRIVNTLSETAGKDYVSSDVLGEVIDLRCPCVCVKNNL